MAGNAVAVTAATARIALPTVLTSQRRGIPAAELSGNPALGGGQDLPPPLSPAPAPTLDFSQVVQQLDAFVENGQRSLRFRVDSATGRTVMTVLDAKTEEVIRQIPAEEVLALARNLDRLQGRLIDAEA